MRLLYVGDTRSPHFRAWPAHFSAAGHDVHALHLVPGEAGDPISGVSMHPPPRAAGARLRGAWLAGAVATKQLWRRLAPDLVHSHQVVPCGYLCERAGLAPHVATAWGSEVLMAGRRGRGLVARVARGAELLTADSQHLLDALERSGAAPERLRWVPWGVSAGWREPALAVSPAETAAMIGLPDDRPIVLSPRGTRDIYRQDTFVRAIAELRGRAPEVLGVVVALDPSPKADGVGRVRELVAELGLGDSVMVVPPYPHDRIALAYRAAVAVVSVPESDSAPTSVFEALSLGTAAIVSDLPWVTEPGYSEARLSVVPVGDHLALADAIEHTVAEPSPEDARANMDLVARSFDQDRIFGEVGRAYEALAAGERP
ncbi:MAG: glycosyltransferase family 4 protein [Solirubrobacterales bacterium]